MKINYTVKDNPTYLVEQFLEQKLLVKIKNEAMLQEVLTIFKVHLGYQFRDSVRPGLFYAHIDADAILHVKFAPNNTTTAIAVANRHIGTIPAIEGVAFMKQLKAYAEQVVNHH